MKIDMLLFETFKDEYLSRKLEWYNEPATWHLDRSTEQLTLETDENTDFWQKTHYGFQADNGHFLYTKTDKNFRMTTKVEAYPSSKYDQAGLMIRFSEGSWLKTSLEYIPGGVSKLGAVVTNHGYSDWSTQYVDTKSNAVELYYRLSRINQDCYVDFSFNGENWNQIRIAHLHIPLNATVTAGIYACSPQGKKQKVCFDFLKIEKLSDDSNQAYL